jgi:hypothetical protein
MPQRLIALMELKEMHLGTFFFSGAVRKDILSWAQYQVDAVVNEIIEDTELNIKYNLLQKDGEVCPYCASYSSCENCFFGKVHGMCNVDGSFYERLRRGLDGGAGLFDNLSQEEVLRCLKD